MADLTPTDAAERIGELEAALQACLLHAEHMDQALASRDVIGQAKGVIMAKTGKDPVAAFAELVDQSQRLSEKLRDVAQRIASATEHD
jgi:AmiR/NasT family two-component response regulator